MKLLFKNILYSIKIKSLIEVQMKLILIFLLLSYVSYGQDSIFTFTPNGFTDYVVTKIEGKSQNELYKKTIDWVTITYKSPNDVIKAKIENDFIRIEGSNNDMMCMRILGSPSCNLAKYLIEISFKEGKYKFDLTEIRQYVTASEYTSGGWYEFGLPTSKTLETNPEAMNAYFNDEGEPKKPFKYYVENIPAEFNRLNQSLKDFLLNDKIPSQQKDW